jgi:hypothetical protein
LSSARSVLGGVFLIIAQSFDLIFIAVIFQVRFFKVMFITGIFISSQHKLLVSS